MRTNAEEYISSEIKKHGFNLAYNYFAYNIDWSKELSDYNKECQEVFDRYYESHGE